MTREVITAAQREAMGRNEMPDVEAVARAIHDACYTDSISSRPSFESQNQPRQELHRRQARAAIAVIQP